MGTKGGRARGCGRALSRGIPLLLGGRHRARRRLCLHADQGAIGRVAVVIPTGMDITERVQGERIRRAYEEERRRAETLASLRASEERFRSALLNSPLPTLLFDDQEQILAVSRSFLEEAGYSREELRRMEDWTDRAYPERSPAGLEQFRHMISIQPTALRGH